MRRLIPAVLAALMTGIPESAMAGAGSFTLVNGTGAGLSGIAIHRFGTSGWQPLAASLAAGTQSSVPFSDPDCAFDIQATVADGGTATWSAVNLCEVRVVTLRRNASGETWAEYD